MSLEAKYREHFGYAGEAYVAQQLQKNGFIIIAQNYSIQAGEIDIVAKKDDLIIFVEVKARKNALVDPAQVITWSKQRKIILTAKHFLATCNIPDDELILRFDVALLTARLDGQMSIEYIEDAFQSQE